jgi:hypothetical protein
LLGCLYWRPALAFSTPVPGGRLGLSPSELVSRALRAHSTQMAGDKTK